MRILLCDDEIHSLHRLKTTVAAACPAAELLCFERPESALAAARRTPPDVAFLDIHMSGMDGLTMGRQLKELYPAMGLVFCTGYSHFALEAFRIHANGYLLKPYTAEDIRRELEALSAVQVSASRAPVLRTFGNFELLLDGQAVSFSRARSKEILAYLTDRNGSEVTAEEICTILWNGSALDRKLYKQLYVYISALKKDLSEYGLGELLYKTRRGYALHRELVDCDYFHLLDGDLAVLNRYSGEYMSQYSWAEFTNGILANRVEQ